MENTVQSKKSFSIVWLSVWNVHDDKTFSKTCGRSGFVSIGRATVDW